MPIKGNFYVPPIDYSTVTGRKWQITGFNIASAHPEAIFLDHSTGMAHALFSGAIEGGQGYYNTGATGIYSASGQYDSRDLTVSWGVVNPATNLEASDSALLGGYLEGFEVNFYDEAGTFYSGINFEDNGSIQKVDLLAGGSGYLNPTVIVTGVYEGGEYQAPSGTGAYIKVKTLGSGLHKSGEILSVPESGLGYLSGIYHVDVVSGGSGYTQNTVLLITGSGGPGGAGLGSGANLKINPLGLGKRYGYSSASSLTIPYVLNKDIFGGTAKRKYQIEVIAVDYYNQRTTGRLMVDFPKPKLGDVVLTSSSNEISFNINPPVETFGGKTFENISLQDIAIYRDETQNFAINNEIGKSNFLTNFPVDNSKNGEGRLANLGKITIPAESFTEDDSFRGYYYKFVPVDDFGTGDAVSYATGIRVSNAGLAPEAPSGVRLIVDPEKTVGTNIEGATITNTYITWKKDRQFRANNYEIILDDNVEKESYILTSTVPSISGIDYMVSGTGSTIATNDQNLFVPLPAQAYPRSMFDIFKPHGAAGVSWSDHTIYLDEKGLPTFGNSFSNVRVIDVAAGNTASGYVYFSGDDGYTTDYVADNRLLENEGVALVARNVKGEILTEYEPRIKIPTKKDGQYSIKIKSYAEDISMPSAYSRTVSFTASGNSSHFAFTPGTSKLRLGGTGDITVDGDFATTVGGSGIVAVGDGIVVVGGVDNRATGEAAALVGGSGNRLIGNVGDPQEGHFLGGGALNTGSGQYTAIVGGIRNSAQGHASFLGGGTRNYIPHDILSNDASTATSYSLIGGGFDNTVSGTASIVVGGRENKVGTNAAIGETTATRFVNWDDTYGAAYSTIAGGEKNELYASHSFIGGGYQNIIYSDFVNYANILGGRDNIISGTSSSEGSAILAGGYNKLVDAGSALAGGSYSSGTADYTLALGTRSWAAHKGAFVLSDSLTPSAEQGTIAKKSHGEDTLNLFFENGTYLRNGSLFVSGGTTISGGVAAESGHLSVQGSGYFADGIVFGDGTTQTTASAGGGGGGAVTAVANGADNRVATFSSSTALNGEANLTFDGTRFTVDGDASITGELRVNRSGLYVKTSDAEGSNLVGINTVSPQADLHIDSVQGAGMRISRQGLAGYLQLYPAYSTIPTIMGNGAGGLHLGYASNAAGIRISTDNKVQISPDQNVAPQAMFVVSGDASITGELRVNSDIVMPQDKYLYFEGDADDAFNRIGRNNSENAILTTSRFHIANIIDSNNDDTTAEFSVRHNGTTIAGSTSLFSVNAGGTSTFSHGGSLGGEFDTTVYIDTYNSTGDNSSTLALRKSRNNTVGVVAQTVDGDSLGAVQFHGVRTDSAFITSSHITAIQNGAAGGTYVPSDLVFTTSTDSAVAEKVRITKDGLVGIGTALPSGRFHVNNAGTGIIVANEHITGNAFEVHGAQGNLLTITDDLSDSLMSVNDAAGMPVFEVFADDTIKSYRNNESKFEIDPDNNRIRLRDNAYVSGNLYVSGSVVTADGTSPDHISGLSGYFGKVGIGTTADYLSDTKLRLLVYADGDQTNENNASFWIGSTAVGDQALYAGVNNTNDYSYIGSVRTSQAYEPLILNPNGGSVAVGTVSPQAKFVVNGDASITGELKTNSNAIFAGSVDCTHLTVDSNLNHDGDADTYIGFTADRIRLNAGGLELIDAREAGANYVAIGGLDANQDVNFYVNNAADGGTKYTLAVDAGASAAGINCEPADAPGAALVVSGDASITGEARFNDKVGIGVAPDVRFFVSASESDVLAKFINTDTTNGIGLIVKAGGTAADKYVADFRDGSNNTRLKIFADGRTDIQGGDTRLRADTHVSGNLYVSGSVVTADGTSPDHVSGLSGYFGKVGIGTTQMGANARVVVENGYVGVGTTDPIGRTHLYQSGDAIPALLVEGSQGSLFSVEDSLTGSLMSVNDIAGLPVFEAFDNGAIIMGQYNSGDFTVTGNAVGIGTLVPTRKLHILSTDENTLQLDASAGQPAVFWAQAGANKWEVRAEAGIMQWYDYTNSSWLMNFAGNKVGIGTQNPDGSRLRVSGDAGITGELKVHGHTNLNGNLTCQSTIFTSQYIKHYGDDDTNISFTNDSIVLSAGGVTMIDAQEATAGSIYPAVKIGGARGDVNLMVGTALDGGTDYLLWADATKSNVGINVAGSDDIEATLQVSGDASITGEFRVNRSGLFVGGGGGAIADDYVGIGTTNPDSALEIYQNNSYEGNTQLHIHNDKTDDAAVIKLEGKRPSANDFGQVVFNNNGNNAAVIQGRFQSKADDGALAFFTSAPGTDSNVNEAMRITNTGNVGIGTTGPVKALDVRASESWDGIHIGSTAGSATSIDFARSTTHANPTARIGVAEPAATHTSDIRFFTSDADGGAPNLVEKMRVNEYGQVGIGVTAPQAKLQVDGDASISGSLSLDGDSDSGFTQGLIIKRHASSHYGYLNMVGGALNINNTQSVTKIMSNGSTTMTVKNANVGIGTTNPSARLTVDGGSGVVVDATSNGYGGVRIHDDSGGDYNVYMDMGRDQGNTRFHIRRAGRVANSDPWNGTNVTPPDVAVFSHSASYVKSNLVIGFDTNDCPGTSSHNYGAMLTVSGDASITGELRVANTAGAALAVGVEPTQVHTSHRSLQIGGNTNIQSYGTKGAGGEVDFCHNVYYNQDGNYKLISADEGTLYRQGAAKHEFYSWASNVAGSNISVNAAARVLQLTAAPNLGARFVGDVQISPDHNVAPQATLVVSGDASISGELRTKHTVATLGLRHESTTHMRQRLYAASANPYISFGDGNDNWGLGVDNDDSTAFKISNTSDHAFAKNRLKITTDGATDIQGGNIRLRDNTYVSGNLYVSGSVVTADGTSPDHISGLSGYFGKVGIGTTQMGADARLVVENGKVGIGTTNPATLFHIDDDASAAGLTIKGAGAGYANAGVRLLATNGTNVRALGVFMHDAGGDTEWFAGRPYATSDQYIIGRKASLATPDYETAIIGNSLFSIKNDGKVGIGTTSPTADYILQASGAAYFNGDLAVDNRGNRADSTQDTVQDTKIRFYAGTNTNWNSFDVKYIRVAGPGTAPSDRFAFENAGGKQPLTVYNDGSAGKVTAGGDWTNGHPEAAFSVSGDASITGELRTNDVRVGGDLYVDRQIYHYGDTHTYLDFTADRIRIYAGDYEMLNLEEDGSSSEVAVNDGGVDLNFRVESEGNENMIFVDAGNDLVGFGTPSPSASYTVTVSGGLAADYKSFIISHPDPAKPDKDLAYGSSETDEHNVFVRGQAHGKVIDLPDYWPYLVHEESITVQLTPVGEHQELYVESIKDNRILINNKKENKINCFYLVHAERQDIGKLQVEPDKCNK